MASAPEDLRGRVIRPVTTRAFRGTITSIMPALIHVLRYPHAIGKRTTSIVNLREEDNPALKTSEEDTEDSADGSSDNSEASMVSVGSSSEDRSLIKNALDACPWIREGDSHYNTLLRSDLPEDRDAYPDIDRFFDAFSLLLLHTPNVEYIELFSSPVTGWFFEVETRNLLGTVTRNWQTGGLFTSFLQVMRRVTVAAYKDPDTSPFKNLTRLDLARIPTEFAAALMAVPTAEHVALHHLNPLYFRAYPAWQPRTQARDIYIHSSHGGSKFWAEDLARHTDGPCHIIKDPGSSRSGGEEQRWLVLTVAGEVRGPELSLSPGTLLPLSHNDSLNKVIVERARAWAESDEPKVTSLA